MYVIILALSYNGSGAALGNLAWITVRKNKNKTKKPNTQPLDQELAVTTPAMPWLLTELVLNSKRDGQTGPCLCVPHLLDTS